MATNQVTLDGSQKWGDGTNSTIGPQFNTFKWDKQALIDARPKSILMNQADVDSIPKHFGQSIKKYHYIPVLDDRNANDQGIDATGAVIADGNLYGSSRDVGTITGKLPVLTEHGGRVNRIGFTRLQLTGSFATFGFFSEKTKASMDYDTDAEKERHLRREMVSAAHEITEHQLVIDLLDAAGIIYYGGDATSMATISGEAGGTISAPTYDGLMRIQDALDLNRAPSDTKMITGTRLIDTLTVADSRFVYVGTKHRRLLTRMKNTHNEPAMVPVRQYAAGGYVANGEIGAIEGFRFIRHPDWLVHEGAGATVGSNGGNAGYAETAGKYDVHSMLFVGSGSFTAITFNTDGNDIKYRIQSREPGEMLDSTDPYGFIGLTSIYWHYGFMALRPEWIAKYLTVVPQ